MIFLKILSSSLFLFIIIIPPAHATIEKGEYVDPWEFWLLIFQDISDKLSVIIYEIELQNKEIKDLEKEIKDIKKDTKEILKIVKKLKK